MEAIVYYMVWPKLFFSQETNLFLDISFFKIEKKFLGSPNVTKNRTAKGKHYVDASSVFIKNGGEKMEGRQIYQTFSYFPFVLFSLMKMFQLLINSYIITFQ